MARGHGRPIGNVGAYYVNPTAHIPDVIGFSSATTDGADVAAGAVSPVIGVTSATTDGADISAASVGPIVALSTATTDGADTISGAVSAIVANSVAATDGADVLASSGGPVVALSGATTDGVDTVAATVSPIVGFGSATANGEDIALGFVENGAGIPTNEVNLHPRRWYLKRGKRFLIFNTAADADAWAEAERAAERAVKAAQKTSRLARKRVRERIYAAAPTPQVIDTSALRQLLMRLDVAVDIAPLIAQQNFNELVRLQLMALQMQDEDDVEMLLLA